MASDSTKREMSLMALNFCPPRFNSQEDAELFMQCLKEKRDYTGHWIHPFVLVDGRSVISAEYDSAPFEVRYV